MCAANFVCQIETFPNNHSFQQHWVIRVMYRVCIFSNACPCFVSQNAPQRFSSIRDCRGVDIQFCVGILRLCPFETYRLRLASILGKGHDLKFVHHPFHTLPNLFSTEHLPSKFLLIPPFPHQIDSHCQRRQLLLTPLYRFHREPLENVSMEHSDAIVILRHYPKDLKLRAINQRMKHTFGFIVTHATLLIYVHPSKLQCFDNFTKPLPLPSFSSFDSHHQFRLLLPTSRSSYGLNIELVDFDLFGAIDSSVISGSKSLSPPKNLDLEQRNEISIDRERRKANSLSIRLHTRPETMSRLKREQITIFIEKCTQFILQTSL
ncbi:putative ribonuclease H protein [Senna tora]|uniref:Putative ribonuclease H protein n=1 Tax=Senna tora TaxID=362788 RepID=A0A834TP72_9FABA|nr:putative ribonuclease H protein [Senna tora]